MPALGHSEKGQLGGRWKSGAERCPHSPGRPVPRRSAPAPPPPPRLPLSSRLASLLRRGRTEAESRCSSAVHAPSLPGSWPYSKPGPAYRPSGLLGAGPRLSLRDSAPFPVPALLALSGSQPSPRGFPALTPHHCLGVAALLRP